MLTAFDKTTIGERILRKSTPNHLTIRSLPPSQAYLRMVVQTNYVAAALSRNIVAHHRSNSR